MSLGKSELGMWICHMTRDVSLDLLDHLTVVCIQMTALQRACSKVKRGIRRVWWNSEIFRAETEYHYR